jgi:hypothetical protein
MGNYDQTCEPYLGVAVFSERFMASCWRFLARHDTHSPEDT